MTIFMTPGPTQLHPVVRPAIEKALQDNLLSISHRSKTFEALMLNAKQQLRDLITLPEDYQIFFFGSATECWERLLQNLVLENSFHFVNGAFSQKFYKAARALGFNAVKHEVPAGKGFRKFVEVPEDTELIAFTHNETSTGIYTPWSYIKQYREQYPDKLIAIDVVSALPCLKFEANQVDVGFFSVQKCFGLPAGLGVMFVSPRALEKAKFVADTGRYVGTHTSFQALHDKALINQTPTTPNVLGIYLLGEVCAAFNKQGGQAAIIEQTKQRQKELHAELLSLSGTKIIGLEAGFNSPTTIAVEAPDLDAVKDYYAEQGIVIGNGYGEFKERQVRVANFPATKKAPRSGA